MDRSGVLWFVALTGALAFAVSGVFAARPQTVRVTLTRAVDEAGLDLHVVGPLDVIRKGVSFPKSGDGVSIEWGDAHARVGGTDQRILGLRAVDSGRLAVEVSPRSDPEAECSLVYSVRAGQVAPSAQDLRQASAFLEAEIGVVDLETALPRAMRGTVQVEVALDDQLLSQGARLVHRSGSRFVIWHPAGANFSGGNVQGVRIGTDPDPWLDEMERVVRRVAGASGARELPYLILDSRASAGLTSIGSGVLVIRAAGAGPRTAMAMGLALWTAAWLDYADLPETSLANNILRYGAQYLGPAAVAGPEELAELQEYSIHRYFHALAAARVLPIPVRPIGKENWHLLIPGLLSMLHAGLPESAWGPSGFFDVMASIAEGSETQAMEQVLQAAAMDPKSMEPMMRFGRIPGLECPVPIGVDLAGLSAASDAFALPGSAAREAIDIVAGANVDQYLEACGCKSSQAGGLARRATILELEGAMCALRVDCGGFMCGVPISQIDGEGRGHADAFIRAFATLPVDAVTLGYKEVCAGLGVVLDEESPIRKLPLVCANLTPPPGCRAIDAYTVVERAGLRVAVVGWSSTRVPPEQMANYEAGLAGWSVQDDFNAIRPVIARAGGEADLVVLIGDLGHAFLRAGAAALGGVDIVVTSDGSDPSLQAMQRPYRSTRARPTPYRIGQTVVLTVPFGTAAMARFDGVRPGVVPEAVAQIVLDEAIQPHPTVEEVISGLNIRFEEDASVIQIRAVPGAGFLGAERCAECHPGQHGSWLRTPHASAMQTLQRRRRDRQVACVQCHVTGFGVDRGFAEASLRPVLQGVQCEACHGPGEAHASSLSPDDITLTPSPATCLGCHDAEHSDQFVGRFTEAFQAISHSQSSQ